MLRFLLPASLPPLGPSERPASPPASPGAAPCNCFFPLGEICTQFH